MALPLLFEIANLIILDQPARVLLSCMILVIFAFLLFTIADIISFGWNFPVEILKNIAYSLSALAGQSGLHWYDGFKFWVAIFEYILGVVLFATFVNALYVRYKD